jgi:hypothetical protein
MESDREFYLKRIKEILQRPLEYPEIKEYSLGRVIWIGRPGYSASVEVWIKKVWDLLKPQSTGL